LGEWRYSSTHSLTSALDGSEWSASRPGRFISRERAPGTYYIGVWVGPRAGLDAVAKRKNSLPCLRRESNPGRRVRSPGIVLIAVPWFAFHISILQLLWQYITAFQSCEHPKQQDHHYSLTASLCWSLNKAPHGHDTLLHIWKVPIRSSTWRSSLLTHYVMVFLITPRQKPKW